MKLAAPNAEAAAWVARLNADDVSDDDRAACSRWLAESENNRRALAETTLAWEAAGAVVAERRPARALRPAAALSRRAVLVAGLGGVAATGFWVLSAPKTYATEVGEIRSLALEDGSSAVLDTNSAVRITVTPRTRHVELLRGRVAVNVRADPHRPFVITSGGARVVTQGGDCEVARDKDDVLVTSLRGQVQVSAGEAPAVQLNVGDRLTADPGRAARIDHPVLDRETAWRSGRLIFDDEPLSAAVTAVNRYTRRAVLVDPSVAQLRLSGEYRVGDASAFAHSVAALFDLRVVEASDHVQLEPARSRI